MLLRDRGGSGGLSAPPFKTCPKTTTTGNCTTSPCSQTLQKNRPCSTRTLCTCCSGSDGSTCSAATTGKSCCYECGAVAHPRRRNKTRNAMNPERAQLDPHKKVKYCRGDFTARTAHGGACGYPRLARNDRRATARNYSRRDVSTSRPSSTSNVDCATRNRTHLFGTCAATGLRANLSRRVRAAAATAYRAATMTRLRASRRPILQRLRGVRYRIRRVKHALQLRIGNDRHIVAAVVIRLKKAGGSEATALDVNLDVHQATGENAACFRLDATIRIQSHYATRRPLGTIKDVTCLDLITQLHHASFLTEKFPLRLLHPKLTQRRHPFNPTNGTLNKRNEN
jgi:hypothetical protein